MDPDLEMHIGEWAGRKTETERVKAKAKAKAILKLKPQASSSSSSSSSSTSSSRLVKRPRKTVPNVKAPAGDATADENREDGDPIPLWMQAFDPAEGVNCKAETPPRLHQPSQSSQNASASASASFKPSQSSQKTHIAHCHLVCWYV